MPSHPIKIAIFGNECQHHNEQAIARVVRCLAQRNAETYVDKPFLNFLRRNRWWKQETNPLEATLSP